MVSYDANNELTMDTYHSVLILSDGGALEVTSWALCDGYWPEVGTLHVPAKTLTAYVGMYNSCT